ncbi:MAG TPA: Rdx family protein [Dehalococcoidia bacterium]|nr:Rdx family protein [Dehalococcoidia bacterium]
MQRAVWTAAEILAEYQPDIERFDLEMGGGGDFEFWINDELAYSKRETGTYPEMGELKTAVVLALAATPA